MSQSPKWNSFLRSFADNPTEENASGLVDFSRHTALDHSEIADLALILARSGTMLRPDDTARVSDIASTGGPGSLSTLLTPLILSASGHKVIKLTVPGRPAGAIDCLVQLDNYSIEPEIDDVRQWLAEGNYVHFLANDRFAPLDALLFSYRKKSGNLQIPSLVIASILSKKIAVGVTNLGLDVRVSDFGNFGSTWDEARSNSDLFNRVANFLGIESRYFISNGFYPQQPYFGRGESLLALRKVFDGEESDRLREHVSECYAMAVSVIGANKTDSLDLSREALKLEFDRNLQLQNSGMDSFIRLTERVENEHVRTIRSPMSGFLTIDLEELRASIISVQNKYSNRKFPDPCGVILRVSQFDYLAEGDIICTYRCSGDDRADFESDLSRCFGFTTDRTRPNELEEIA